ncbi:hypothetical protein; putative signal peptide [Bradyrhizobium sp. ORS 278]|nr:hypothetical protein; putative signal peptide [Bradyrhizobium sp. ORS 278]
MTSARLAVVAAIVALTFQPALAQNGRTSNGQSGARYTIDGPGGGVPTAKPPATQPVPAATSLYPYAGRGRGAAPLTGQTTNVPNTTSR